MNAANTNTVARHKKRMPIEAIVFQKIFGPQTPSMCTIVVPGMIKDKDNKSIPFNEELVAEILPQLLISFAPDKNLRLALLAATEQQLITKKIVSERKKVLAETGKTGNIYAFSPKELLIIDVDSITDSDNKTGYEWLKELKVNNVEITMLIHWPM